MKELLYFILCSYGLTQILIYGKIFDKIRPNIYLFKCPMCLGFWTGICLWMLNNFNLSISLFHYDSNLATGFLLGCLSSGTSYIIMILFDDNGIKIHKKGGEL